MQYPIALISSGFYGSSIPLLMFSIGIYILPLISKLLSACCDIFVHCALSLIILFYICACCDTRCFKNVCLFLLVGVKAQLGLDYMLFNIRYKIKLLCLCQKPRLRLLPVIFYTFFPELRPLIYFKISLPLNIFHQKAMCIKGHLCPPSPMRLKYKNCFSQICSYWFIRTITEV